MSTVPVKVLFVGGFGRSGSTLLDNVLGQVDGFFSAGEVSYLWDRCLEQDRLCSCKRAFSDCPLWSRIVERAFPDRSAIDTQALVAVRESLVPKKVALAAMRGGSARDMDGIDGYLRRLVPLYRAIREETGCRVVVDSSKAPGHGFVLRSTPDLETYALHLIRDSRPVAHSWQKKMVYDPTGDEPLYMTRFSPARSSKLWYTWNLATERVWASAADRYLRMRYEDFVAAPAESLRRILDLVGESVPELPVDEENRFEMGEMHSAAGNPSRFKDGPVEIRRDDKWRSAQPTSHRLLVTLLTFPLLLRYGYLGR
jgi:hypothetical protein